jgi:methionine biosynthesis protein MetW
MRSDGLNLEGRIIADMIPPGATILDLGCGDGDLLSVLVKEKKARAQGIEIDERCIRQCVSRGLSVLHGDIDSGLAEYDDKTFDFVILNQSFQQVRQPEIVLKEALRVGRQVIVAIPNFAHYKARLQIFFQGRTPVTASLPYKWYDTPNLHFLSLSDFAGYCRERNISIDRTAYTARDKRVRVFPNLLALVGIFAVFNGESR